MKRLAAMKFAVFIFFVFSLSVSGQTNEQIERELVGHIKNIQKWSVYGTNIKMTRRKE